mgnify:CR=1 FL=1
MKLLSAVVRNYRVHREVAVEFDGSRTLIGGPNESGKSTLMEAVHRALFLKATVTGEAQAFPASPMSANKITTVASPGGWERFSLSLGRGLR